jgi:hypothetical protein
MFGLPVAKPLIASNKSLQIIKYLLDFLILNQILSSWFRVLLASAGKAQSQEDLKGVHT